MWWEDFGKVAKYFFVTFKLKVDGIKCQECKVAGI